MMKTRKILLLFSVLFSFLFLFSCEKRVEKSGELKVKAQNFIANTENAAVYGYVDLDALKTKSGVDKLEDIAAFLSQQIASLESALDLSEKLYYVIETPVNSHGSFEVFFGFLQIKDGKKLETLLDEMGYFFEEEQGINYFYDDNLGLAYDKENVVVLYTQENHEKFLLSAFEKMNKTSENQHISINGSDDIRLVVNYDKLLDDADLRSYSEKIAAELLKFKDQSSFSLSLNFEDGLFAAELDFSQMNDYFLEKSPFKEKSVSMVLEHFLEHEVNALTLASLNTEALDYWLELFDANENKGSYWRELGQIGLILEGVSKGKVGDVTNGDIAVAMVQPEIDTLFNLSELQLYLGLGDEKENVLAAINSLQEGGNIKEIAENTYEYDDFVFKIVDGAVYLYSKEIYSSNSAPFELSPSLEEAANYPFFSYGDLKPIANSFLGSGRKELDMLDYYLVKVDQQKIVFEAYMADREKNFLAQLVDGYKNFFK